MKRNLTALLILLGLFTAGCVQVDNHPPAGEHLAIASQPQEEDLGAGGRSLFFLSGGTNIKPNVASWDIHATDELRFDGEIQPDGDTCAAGEILKRTGADDWDCAADAGAGVTDTFTSIEVDGVGQSTNAPTLDFDSGDFTLTESPTDDFDVTLAIDTFAELQSQIADKTLVNEEDAVTWDSLNTFAAGLMSTASSTMTRASTTEQFSTPTLRVDNIVDYYGTACSGNNWMQDIGDDGSFSCGALDTSGDWTGLFDGQEGSYYLEYSNINNRWGTSSTDFWETTQTARTADDLSDNTLSDLSDVDDENALFGNLLSYTGSGWATTTTSTLAINTDNLVEGITNLFFTTARIDSHLSGDEGITYSAGSISFDCSEVEGVGINCTGEDITLDATGDWTGTLDGLEASQFLRSDTTDTSNGEITFEAGLSLNDNDNITFGTGNDVTLDFDGSNLVLTPLVGSPVVTSTMPFFVSADRFSRFGYTPTHLNEGDVQDIFVSNKQHNTSGGGTRRGALIVSEFTGSSNFTGTQYGLNGFAYNVGAASGNITKTNDPGGLVGGRYAVRHRGSGTLALGGGVASAVDIQDAGAGAVTDAYAYLAEGNDGSSVGITNSYNYLGRDSSGTVTNAYGLYQDEMTNAINNYEMVVEGAGGLWFNINNSQTEFINSATVNRLDLNAQTAHDFNIAGSQEASLAVNTLTFEAGASDPVLSWTTSGLLALTTGDWSVLNNATTTGSQYAGSLRLNLNCTGNANGGALTTDANGNVECSDDDAGGGGGAGAAWEEYAANVLTPTNTSAGIQVNSSTSTITNLSMNRATSSDRLVLGTTNPTNDLGLLWIGGDSYTSGNTTTTGNLWIGDATNGAVFDIADGGFKYYGTSKPTSTIVLTAGGGTEFSATTTKELIDFGGISTARFYVLEYKDNGTASSSAQWPTVMPDSWDGGEIYAYFYHTATTTSGSCTYCIRAASFGDGDIFTGDKWGDSVCQNVTVGSVDGLEIGTSTAAITVGNSPSAGDEVLWEVWRDSNDDSRSNYCRLVKTKLEYSVDSESD